MKALFTMTAILLAASVSSAKTFCSISSGIPQRDMVYDRSLFSGEITSPKYILVNKDLTAAAEVQLSQFTTMEQWKAIDGQVLVSFSNPQNDTYGITVGQIDMSKADTNALPLVALAVGPVTEKGPLTLVVPQNRLSTVCFRLP
jgi:hypothetical protein